MQSSFSAHCTFVSLATFPLPLRFGKASRYVELFLHVRGQDFTRENIICANKTEIDISTAREQKGLGTIGVRHDG